MNKFNTYTGTTADGSDIIPTLKTYVGLSSTSPFCLKKIQLICDSAIGWSLNGESVPATLLEDSLDGKYKLAIDNGDMIINSMIPDTSSVNYYIAFTY